ncbi:hypothetical protein [Streptosporangium sp. OZ121]|uniref:hypothetical protein n=1 Tax=Streptosporangium sp. OZ121 TaxID=3444183 RepID=UPI003F7B05BC
MGNIRRTEISYPDGVEISVRFPMPLSPMDMRASCRIPSPAFLCHLDTDTDDDGQTYGFVTYWISAAVTSGDFDASSDYPMQRQNS